MKKIALVFISILFLSGLAYSQEVPEDGIIKKYFDSGQLMSEFTYENGLRDGVARLYYRNGHIRAEINFKNDKEDGISKEYYYNGNVMFEFNMKNGKLIKQTSYEEDGKLIPQYILNDRLAESTIRTLATAAYTYAQDHDGKYPLAMEDLINAEPPYFRSKYCVNGTAGYKYSCTFNEEGYFF